MIVIDEQTTDTVINGSYFESFTSCCSIFSFLCSVLSTIFFLSFFLLDIVLSVLRFTITDYPPLVFPIFFYVAILVSRWWLRIWSLSVLVTQDLHCLNHFPSILLCLQHLLTLTITTSNTCGTQSAFSYGAPQVLSVTCGRSVVFSEYSIKLISTI